jgi:hypothetical protein
MRKDLLLLPLVLACAKSETAQTDSAALTPAPAATLTAEALAGTWHGVSMPEGSDSVLQRWTVIGPGAGEAKFVNEGSTDTVTFTSTVDGDSLVATSLPHDNPQFPGAKVMFRSVGRLQGDKLVGTSTLVLADKPDSVVNRGRWEATKAP